MNKLSNNPAKPPHLSPQRKRFADALLTCRNQTEAAIEAGYSKKTATVKASSLLAIVNVKEYIDFQQSEIAKRNEIKQDEIVLGIREVISKCKWPYQPAQLLKAYELLAKMGGYLRDQGIDPEQRPAFVGISINMGKGTVEMMKDSQHSKTEIIDVTDKLSTN